MSDGNSTSPTNLSTNGSFNLIEIRPPNRSLSKNENDQAQANQQPEAPAKKQAKIRALKKIGRHFQAQRYEQCGQKSLRIDPRIGEVREVAWHCGFTQFCEECNGLEAWSKKTDGLEDIARLEAIDKKHRYKLAIKVSLAELRSRELYAAINKLPSERGQLTQAKEGLRTQLRDHRALLQSFAGEWVDPTNAIAELNRAIQLLKNKGLPKAELTAHLQVACAHLHRAVKIRLSYCLQAITLSRRTDSDTYPEVTYRDLVRAIKGENLSRLLKGLLCAPGYGAITSVHLQENVNLHMLYWGPPISQIELQTAWFEITSP